MGIERFSAAEAEFQAGRFEAGILLMETLLIEDPEAPVAIYRNFATLLVRRKQYEQAQIWAARGAERFPRDSDLKNLLGISLRRLRRYEDAQVALQEAVKYNAKNKSALTNLANVFNDTRNPAAIDIFLKLVRQTPGDADLQRGLGRAYWFAGDLSRAEMRLSLSTKLKPSQIDAWLDLSAVVADLKSPEQSVEVLIRAMAANPRDIRLVQGAAMAMRRNGQSRKAEQLLMSAIDEQPGEGALHFQLATNLADYDRPRANAHFELAIERDPLSVEYKVGYAESLGRSRHGDEAENLEKAYKYLRDIIDVLPETPNNLKVAYDLTIRMADFAGNEKLGSFRKVGRTWAEAGRHAPLLIHLARVKTLKDRLELIEQHRIWGRLVAAGVARQPIARPARRAPNGKIRVGFMSSDLRSHPVAYFALPLFQYYDHSRFEIYCYSFYQGEEDSVQQAITKWVDAFRWEKDISDRDAAQMIANDQLDMLIELGGSTHMNKLTVMGFKPAPLSASWVGYPHSAGPEEIDYLVLDPYMVPDNLGLLIEKPMILPKAWYALGEHAFRDEPAVNPAPPVERNGYITFGTANQPYKYGKDLVGAWAQAMARTPNSRFLFIRPEGNAPTFRDNLRKVFAEHGVDPSRVDFEPVRGKHLPFYNEIDISLDPFPQTGGTSTCEALWMGAPVITRVGDAVFERLSYSVLMNLDLGELVARSTEEYIDIAVKLAHDPARIGELRRTLRERMRASPLGQQKQWAEDYYAAIEKVVADAGLPI